MNRVVFPGVFTFPKDKGHFNQHAGPTIQPLSTIDKTRSISAHFVKGRSVTIKQPKERLTFRSEYFISQSEAWQSKRQLLLAYSLHHIPVIFYRLRIKCALSYHRVNRIAFRAVGYCSPQADNDG